MSWNNIFESGGLIDRGPLPRPETIIKVFRFDNGNMVEVRRGSISQYEYHVKFEYAEGQWVIQYGPTLKEAFYNCKVEYLKRTNPNYAAVVDRFEEKSPTTMEAIRKLLHEANVGSRIPSPVILPMSAKEIIESYIRRIHVVQEPQQTPVRQIDTLFGHKIIFKDAKYEDIEK